MATGIAARRRMLFRTTRQNVGSLNRRRKFSGPSQVAVIPFHSVRL